MDNKRQLAIPIEYGDKFKKQVEQGDPNPAVKFKVKVNETYLIGSETEFHLSENLCFFLLDLLDAAQSVLEEDEVKMHLPTNPAYLCFDRQGSDVEVSFRFVGDEDSKRCSVKLSDFLDEVLRVSKQAATNITQFDPSLSNDKMVQSLEKKISSLQESMS